jgi:hypothetical protein
MIIDAILRLLGIVVDEVDLDAWVTERAADSRHRAALRIAWSMIQVPGISRSIFVMSRPEGEQ